MSEGILLAIVGGVFSLAVAITGGIFQRGNRQKQKEKERDATVREERNKKDAVERRKNRAHDALTRQIAWHLIDGNDTPKLTEIYEDAIKAEKAWTETETAFYEKLDRIEAKYK
jgi:glycosyltransferase A (GT-A) superfamily protein (DUF2064 family)